MKNFGKLIFTDDFGNQVFAAVMQDASSTRISVEVYLILNNGKMSDIISIPRKKIYASKNTFDIFYDFEGMSNYGVDKIRNAIMDMLRDDPHGYVQSKATMEEIYDSVCKYIRENEEDLKENSDADVFIRNGTGYIETKSFNDFVKENPDLGFKRVDILNRLKMMGVLVPAKERPYDTLVSINGNKRHFYKILMTDQTLDSIPTKKEECENIDVKSIRMVRRENQGSA